MSEDYHQRDGLINMVHILSSSSSLSLTGTPVTLTNDAGLLSALRLPYIFSFMGVSLATVHDGLVDQNVGDIKTLQIWLNLKGSHRSLQNPKRYSVLYGFKLCTTSHDTPMLAPEASKLNKLPPPSPIRGVGFRILDNQEWLFKTAANSWLSRNHVPRCPVVISTMASMCPHISIQLNR